MTLLYPYMLLLLAAPLYLYRLDSSQKRMPIVLALMIVALSRPAVMRHEHSKAMEATEAVIALDLSYSMRADDIVPSRLEAAKATIKKLIASTPQNRYALFGFTTNPLILAPYTSDGLLLEEAIDAIDADNILTKGTSLLKLLRYLGKAKIPVKNLILFTDGGDAHEVDALVRAAKNAGIRIIAVGMATCRGAMLKDSYGKSLKDSSGALVVTRLNPILPRLARESGGLFIPWRSISETASDVAAALEAIAEKARFSQREAGYLELYWIPLLAALLLFFVTFVKVPRKLLLLLPFIAQSGEAFWLDWYHIDRAHSAYARGAYEEAAEAFSAVRHKTIQSEFNRALLLYREGKYRETITLLERLKTRDPVLKEKILFLLGNALVRTKRYSRAAAVYQQALALKEDAAVLHNLQLILGKKEQKKRKPPVFKKKHGKKRGVATAAQKPKSQTKTAQGRVKEAPKKRRILGYKAYELINKGYIDEKRPW